MSVFHRFSKYKASRTSKVNIRFDIFSKNFYHCCDQNTAITVAGYSSVKQLVLLYVATLNRGTFSKSRSLITLEKEFDVHHYALKTLKELQYSPTIICNYHRKPAGQ
jgi:hypothetical protein